ncbi:MAG: 5-formyltetrahydrofolate cyclo-ligase [Nitrospirae bacterium]|nr:5-formyltetrahydrofolate cyclo-ligase [Nitrospirota bacterium]
MIIAKKKEIRHEILRKRNSLSLNDRIEKSREICERLFGLSEFKEAKVVHFYINTKSEVITEEAVRMAMTSGKDVVVPVIDKKHHRIFLSKLLDYEMELSITSHGIYEPLPDFHREVPVHEIQLMILPGVAFDLNGHRLGYGAGYYDKLLENEEHRPLLVALAYELQIVEYIPVGSHDVKMDKIVTEERIVEVRGKK